MASRYEVEVKIASARGLKNVNWRYGANRPYAVVWVDPKNKCSTKVDEAGNTEANWDHTLLIPLPVGMGHIKDFTIYIDIVHAGSQDHTKPLIGSARLKLTEVLDCVRIGKRASRTLTLKRPSGRPQGKVDVMVAVKDNSYRAPGPGGYYAPPYGVPYGGGYNAPPQSSYYSALPPLLYAGYNALPLTESYGEGSHGFAAASPGMMSELISRYFEFGIIVCEIIANSIQ